MYLKSALVVELPTVWMQMISLYFGIENEFVQFVFSDHFGLCLACQHQNLLPVSVDVELWLRTTPDKLSSSCRASQMG